MREGLLALSFNASVAIRADELNDEQEGRRKDLDMALRKRHQEEGHKRHLEKLRVIEGTKASG